MANNGQLYLVVFEICSRTRYRAVPLPNYKLVVLLASASINPVRANLPNCLSDASVSLLVNYAFFTVPFFFKTHEIFTSVSLAYHFQLDQWCTTDFFNARQIDHVASCVVVVKQSFYDIILHDAPVFNTILQQETFENVEIQTLKSVLLVWCFNIANLLKFNYRGSFIF